MSKKTPFIVRATIVLLFVTLLLHGLVQARSFLTPLLLGILFSYLLYPLANFLEKKGLPRIPSILITIVLALVIVVEVVYFLYTQISMLVDDFPELKKQALQNIDEMAKTFESNFGVGSEEVKIWAKERVGNLFESGSSFLNDFFTTTAATVATIGILPVFIFFILYNRNKFAVFILKVIPQHRQTHAIHILKQVSIITQKYMSGIFVVVLILCVLNSIGLLIVGIKYAILLGIISAICNFIPYFGTLLGAVFPLTAAMLLMDSPSYAVGVIILFVIIQFTENNILTPNIVGGNVQINPFITILSIIFGGMIWGVAGMFLIIPFMAMFKITCDQIDSLKPIGYLLGTEGTEKHSITIEKIKNLFRRKKKDQEISVDGEDNIKATDQVNG